MTTSRQLQKPKVFQLFRLVIIKTAGSPLALCTVCCVQRAVCCVQRAVCCVLRAVFCVLRGMLLVDLISYITHIKLFLQYHYLLDTFYYCLITITNSDSIQIRVVSLLQTNLFVLLLWFALKCYGIRRWLFKWLVKGSVESLLSRFRNSYWQILYRILLLQHNKIIVDLL